MALTVRDATFAELDTATLYALLRLRAEVFVVEQTCPFNDLDGRDTEPGARHVWLEADDGTIAGYVRLLDEPDGAVKISRVVTAPAARGSGIGDRVMGEALARTAERPVVLDAQTRLLAWYERLGFERAGPDFLEDDILHTPMRRP
jgi:ElaA protein